jgi:branched-chain amino acid transport system ATP-binding protein
VAETQASIASARVAVPVLELEHVQSGYGAMQVLWGVDLVVPSGSCVVLLGANGAGKSTLLKVIMGLLPLWAGAIRFEGAPIEGRRTDRRVAGGIAYMTETAVFGDLSVHENLLLGAFALPRSRAKASIERIYESFPVVREHRRRPAGSLSGGQRKLVGVAKALVAEPRLIVMDEPSSGLSPLAVREVVGALGKVHAEQGTSMLVAEQNVAFTELADAVVVLEGGRVRFRGSVEELQANDSLRRAFFGLEGSASGH